MYGYVLLGLMMGLVSLDLSAGRPAPEALPVVLGMVALGAGVLAAGLALGLRIVRRRGAIEQDEQRFLRSVGGFGKLYRLVVVGAYALMLFVLEWPALVHHWVGGTGLALPAYGLVLVPFVALLVVSWTALYWADRARCGMMFERVGVGSVAGQWTLPRYLGFALRQYLLIVLIPLLGLVALEDVVGSVLGPAGEGPLGVVVLVGVLGVAVVLSGPWIRTCWRTERLPEGGLRDRLRALADRAGVRVRDILVWRTNLSMVNGCMIGAVGPLRYILITDALLLSLPADEVEAVFAHEVGHVKHRHAALFVVLALGGMSAAVVLGELVGRLTDDFWTSTVAMGAAVLGYWWLGFGYVSRRCELESDLYAASMATCPVGCESAGGEGEGICEHTVACFTSALGRIARLNGAAASARGWRHFSVARRCRFLEALVSDPGGAARFRRRVRAMKRGALVLAATAAVAAALVGLGWI